MQYLINQLKYKIEPGSIETRNPGATGEPARQAHP
jgi:hypothetical protein